MLCSFVLGRLGFLTSWRGRIEAVSVPKPAKQCPMPEFAIVQAPGRKALASQIENAAKEPAESRLVLLKPLTGSTCLEALQHLSLNVRLLRILGEPMVQWWHRQRAQLQLSWARCPHPHGVAFCQMLWLGSWCRDMAHHFLPRPLHIRWSFHRQISIVTVPIRGALLASSACLLCSFPPHASRGRSLTVQERRRHFGRVHGGGKTCCRLKDKLFAT